MSFSSDSDHDIDRVIEETLLLGFLNKDYECSALIRHRFPSKVGGFPAWLNPQYLPTPDQLQCGQCSHVMQFICQIYAPLDISHCTFHRTLFVFCCTRGCSHSTHSVKVFRSQLPRDNPYYSPTPLPDGDYRSDHTNNAESVMIDEPYDQVHLCDVCGVAAPKRCSQCHNRFYCSKAHQLLDWRSVHSSTCGTDDIRPNCQYALPQFEVVIEEADLSSPSLTDKEKDLIDKYENEVRHLNESDRADHNELESFQNGAEIDGVFVEFQSLMSGAPDQCIRYQRAPDARPLWVHGGDQLPGAMIGKITCPTCKGPADFEFQIMPQLLSYLAVDAEFDFGTIVVHTCRRSCGSGLDRYMEENVWRQSPPAPMQSSSLPVNNVSPT